MNLLSHFPAPIGLTQYITEAKQRVWNAKVGKRCRFVREEGDVFVFIHPTKGFRRIRKERLGLAG